MGRIRENAVIHGAGAGRYSYAGMIRVVSICLAIIIPGCVFYLNAPEQLKWICFLITSIVTALFTFHLIMIINCLYGGCALTESGALYRVFFKSRFIGYEELRSVIIVISNTIERYDVNGKHVKKDGKLVFVPYMSCVLSRQSNIYDYDQIIVKRKNQNENRRKPLTTADVIRGRLNEEYECIFCAHEVSDLEKVFQEFNGCYYITESVLSVYEKSFRECLKKYHIDEGRVIVIPDGKIQVNFWGVMKACDI